MIDEKCVPYPRKGLYLLLTSPMIVVYILISIYLWNLNLIYFGIYAVLFVGVAFFMSYICVYWECPYVGKFALVRGGILPSFQPDRQVVEEHQKDGRPVQYFHYPGICVLLCDHSFSNVLLIPAWDRFPLRISRDRCGLWDWLHAVYLPGLCDKICLPGWSKRNEIIREVWSG